MARPKMTDRLDQPEEVDPIIPPVQSYGLIARGRVERRIRRVVGENSTEIVSYTLGPRATIVEEWAPASYYQVGEFIELPVEASVYAGRVVFRFSREEEF